MDDVSKHRQHNIGREYGWYLHMWTRLTIATDEAAGIVERCREGNKSSGGTAA